MNEHHPTPTLQSIVLCDCVYSDSRTGKKVLAGTFNTLWSHEFPTIFARSTFVYLCLTEVHGEARVNLRYLDLEKNDALLSLEGLVVSALSPLESVELAIEIPPLPMPHAGSYMLEVDCEGLTLGAVRIQAQQIPIEGETNGQKPR